MNPIIKEAITNTRYYLKQYQNRYVASPHPKEIRAKIRTYRTTPSEGYRFISELLENPNTPYYEKEFISQILLEFKRIIYARR